MPATTDMDFGWNDLNCWGFNIVAKCQYPGKKRFYSFFSILPLPSPENLNDVVRERLLEILPELPPLVDVGTGEGYCQFKLKGGWQK